MSRGAALVTLTLTLLLAACGSATSSSAGGSPAPPATSVSSAARLDSIPLLPRMRVIGSAAADPGVTTRSYELPGHTPKGAVLAYKALLRNGGHWDETVQPHTVGSSYRAAWVSNGNGPIANGYTLSVTAIDAPTLSGGSAGSPTVQMTLQLYSPHSTPSTEPRKP